MNKPLRRVISAILALSLSVTLAVNAYAEEIANVHKHEAVSTEAVATKEKSEKAKKPEKIKITKDNLPEVLDFDRVKEQGFVSRLKSEEQDMCEIILENEDGTRGLYIFDSPVKFKNKNGETVDKSNKVKPHTKNGAPCFKSESNDIEVNLPATIQSGVSLRDEEVNVSMKPIPSVASKRALSVGKQKDEDSVIYEDVFDNYTDIVYTFTYDGVKEDIVLEKYNGKNTFDFEVITGGLSLEEEKGALLLKDENGEVKATMGEIVIFSADNKNNTFGEYKITEKVKNNSYIITVCVDVAYLTSPDTKYPVTIDPTVNANFSSNSSIKDMTIYKDDTSYGLSHSLFVGKREYGVSRTLLKLNNYDFSSRGIWCRSQIQSATIELRDLMCESQQMPVMCYDFQGEQWNENNSYTWDEINGDSYGTTNYGTVNISYGSGNTTRNISDKIHWYQWDITEAVRKWVTNSYIMASGLIFKTNNYVENYNVVKTFGSSNNTNYKPFLSIKYVYTPHEQQPAGSNWCWAACTIMMAKTLYAYVDVTQDEVVEYVHGTADFLAGGNSADVISGLQYCLRNDHVNTYSTPPFTASNTMTEELLRRKLDNGTPVILGVKFTTDNGTEYNHGIIVIGYSKFGNLYKYTYLDPSNTGNTTQLNGSEIFNHDGYQLMWAVYKT